MAVELPILGTDARYTVAPSKIICLGLNYRDHIAESASVRVQGFGHDQPTEPVLFPKLPSCLIGPGDTIRLPKIAESYGFDSVRTDYEAELAVIIGERCRNVDESDALSVVFGYTCANDVSQRNIQNGDRSGWFRGKSFDTFLPVGPAVVPVAQISDVQNLRIRAALNGSIVQESSTSEMIFTVAAMISYISRNFTLEPGDLILTGTPSGVGPLAVGDTIDVTVESIGTLTNTVDRER